jgi:L-histidine N-alpha-methyltransferase
MKEQFAKDIEAGLTKQPKHLSSKYFYDEVGSSLFSKIMKLPEYYLTNAEFEIFQQQGTDIIKTLDIHKNQPFELIELGAGDGYKTIELLKALEADNYNYQYIPIDISKKALDQIKQNVKAQLPNKEISPKKGDYFNILKELKESSIPKVILFLGSNIGNMPDEIAESFLLNLSNSLSKGDKLILGTDLMKSKDIVLPAYNDSEGVTSAFNLNLLTRINRELDADFDIAMFEHAPEYDEKKGIATSAIRSKIVQTVEIKALDLKVSFEAGEKIHTEISRKYNDEIINKIGLNSGLKIIGKLSDSRHYFADYILEKQS